MYKFLGIGAQKAGTTWLYEMLRQHPDISFPLNKEVHFWNSPYSEQSIVEYFSKFQHPSLCQGEITPAYAFLSTTTIEEIHRYQPALKIIYIIRNPIDRAWSSAKMALGRAEMEFHEASEQWFIDHFNSKGSLLRGDYETCLRNWLNVFDTNQILVLKFEDIKQAPDKILTQCCQHIGVQPFSTTQLESLTTDQRVFSTSEQNLSNNLQQHLLTLYQGKIDRLEQYLDINLDAWKYK